MKEKTLKNHSQQLSISQKNVLPSANTLWGKEIQDIKLARQCMNFQLIKCKNKQCLNLSCPLNKKYDK